MSKCSKRISDTIADYLILRGIIEFGQSKQFKHVGKFVDMDGTTNSIRNLILFPNGVVIMFKFVKMNWPAGFPSNFCSFSNSQVENYVAYKLNSK